MLRRRVHCRRSRSFGFAVQGVAVTLSLASTAIVLQTITVVTPTGSVSSADSFTVTP